jgi:putative FmdB family regulatory protein
MPIYEYRCADCAVSFEAFVRPGHLDEAECPHGAGHHLSREMSTFASRSSNGDGASAAAQAINSNGAGLSSALSAPRGGCCGGGCGCH